MAADDAYQLISGYGAYITSVATDGVLANWNDVAGVNFEKPWWNSDIVHEMNVADHLFYITGDLTMTSVEYLFCLFFNKEIMTDNNLEFPYDIVREGKWTFDKMKEYAATYHTTAWDAYNLFCVPRTAPLDFVGVVTENMAARSYEEVLPAFYEKALRSKYARDKDSAEMISIIRAGATYNFGVVNSPHIGRPGHIWRDLISDRSNNIVSKTGSNARAMEKSLDNFLTNTYINAN